MKQIVINGDNIELLKKYPDNYFDAVVTDCPYGLGKEPNASELMKDWIEKGYHEISGKGFMGKEWDAFIPQPVFWKEVFRVLKHGGHVLSFFGTRTYDWGVMSMRFAGFEVRDCIQWLYGSGFPKSHNISKALDKMEGAEREVIGKKERGSVEEAKERGAGFLSDPANRNNTKQFGYGTELITAPSTDAAKQWDGWGTALKPAHEDIVLARKPLEKGLSIAENILKWGVGGINIDASRIGNENRTYKGSGASPSKINNHEKGDTGIGMLDGGGKDLEFNAQGRFPANIILTHHEDCECIGTKKVGKGERKQHEDGEISTANEGYTRPNKSMHTHKDSSVIANYGEEEVENWDCHENCPIRILDEQSGVTKSSKRGSHNSRVRTSGDIYKQDKDEYREDNTYGDKGGSSRFFYVAKASKSERNKGLEKERWFDNLELVFKSCSFTEQNLFIWEQEEQNQNTDLNGEVQQKKDISEGIVLLVEDKECYTTLYGKKNEVLFPKAIKFTTSTGLSQTIELKTLNFYQPLSINDCIADVIETNKENGLNLAENVGLKNLLKQIFTKDEMGFLLGVRLVAKKMPQLINVKDVWKKSNIHSTVKPVKLMQYLVKMITPPNGIVLDPFCGSGTTGVACKLYGFQFVGIEQDPEYAKIAEARINNYFDNNEYVENNEKIEEPIITKPKQQTLF